MSINSISYLFVGVILKFCVLEQNVILLPFADADRSSIPHA